MSNAQNTQWRTVTDTAVIRQFYREEFPQYVTEIPDWITPPKPKQYAVALTERYPINTGSGSVADAPQRAFVRRASTTSSGPRFQTWEDLASFFTYPVQNDPLRNPHQANNELIDPEAHPDITDPTECPAAEAVYYQLDNHDRFWVLAFDIDAKDVAAERVARSDDPRRTDAICEEAGVTAQPPAGYSYTFADIEQSLAYAFELTEILEQRLDFSETLVLYSGQGAHVYALDSDAFHQYTERSRKFLTELIDEKFGIPIDREVTTDDKRVMRMPYSLHTDVGRLVVPIDSPDFDFLTNAVPDVLATASTGEPL